MTTAVVTIICLALIMVGGMTMSQGILTSADTSALSVEEISAREGEIMRTEVNITRAEPLSWSDLLRLTVDNSGQTKLASFSKWDFIISYRNGGTYYNKWLPYTEGALGNDQWEKVRIGLNGPTEYFEPGILNPQEDLVILAKLSPLPGDATTGNISVATPNGIEDSINFTNLGYTRLTPHSENITLGVTNYYDLAEATLSDGPAITETTDVIDRWETGRWLLNNQSASTRPARHLFSLTGISRIPAGTWTVYYRGRADGTWGGGSNAGFSINIRIRRANGTIRQTIATDVANANLTINNNWQTVSGTYYFGGYNVVDDSDYLEIDYYGESRGYGPFSWNNYIRLRIDDGTLSEANQTRIEA